MRIRTENIKLCESIQLTEIIKLWETYTKSGVFSVIVFQHVHKFWTWIKW